MGSTRITQQRAWAVSGTRIGEKLAKAREQAIAGREEELSILQAFARGETAQRLLWIHGPAGVGKSVLMTEGARRIRAAGIPVVLAAADQIPPEPEAIMASIRRGFCLRDGCDLRSWHPDAPHVLVIDAFEHLHALHGWLAQEMLVELPAAVRIVVAGRQSPSPLWSRDPGWRVLTSVLELKDFSHEEAMSYLCQRSVEGSRHGEAFAVSHGHPLALSLIADLLEHRPDSELPLQRSPQIVQTLVGQFTTEVPSQRHREALWVTSLVGFCNQRLLARVLQVDDAASLFDWLMTLSFSRVGQRGVVLHELVRDVLRSDLWWRDPGLYGLFSRRVIESELGLLQQLVGEPRREKIADLLAFIVHTSVRPERVYDGRDLGAIEVSPARSEHWPHIEEMVRRHEGEASLRWLEHWRAQGGQTLVYAAPDASPQGFSMMVPLHEVSPEAATTDPGVEPIYRWLTRGGDDGPPTATLLFRFWMTADSYQAVSELQSRIFLQIIDRVLSTPNLSFMLAVHRDPQTWIPLTTVSQIHHYPAGDFALGGHDYGVFGTDFRDCSVERWSENSILLSLGLAANASVPAPPAPLLDRDAFSEAVKGVLKHLHRPERLRQSPLLTSRLVAERCASGAGALDRAQALTAVIHETAEAFRDSDQQVSVYRILDKTYLRPVAKQEVAAAELRLSFSTYRRRLQQAVDRLTDALWRMDQRGRDAP